MLRIESGLYFANADTVRARILRAASADGIRAVVVDGETIPFIDVTASRMHADLAEELRQQHVQLLIARDVGQVRDILSHVIDDAALAHFYPTVQAAIDATGHDQPAPPRRARTSRASRVNRTGSRGDDEDVDRCLVTGLASPAVAVHNLVERPPLQPCAGRERAVRRIAEIDHERDELALGDMKH